MLSPEFRCLLVASRETDGQAELAISRLQTDSLPEGDVSVEVRYSSLNYKDALACQGHRGIVKSLPHVPGIDASGIVVESQSAEFKPGDHVLVTGYDLGQGRWGGWSEIIRVPADWVVPLPQGLSLREAMILGTAGFTAAQCVHALVNNGVSPNDGEIVVTGASGGVGNLAVQILSKLGYSVVASTGKASEHSQLIELGAKRIVDRQTLLSDSPRPMLSAMWAGGVDTIGGDYLTSILRSTSYGGAVAACGLVAGAELSMTLYPFLLRGIALCGVASADCPYGRRLEMWRRLANEWKPPQLSQYVTEVGLEDVPALVYQMLEGKVAGRVLIAVNS